MRYRRCRRARPEWLVLTSSTCHCCDRIRLGTDHRIFRCHLDQVQHRTGHHSTISNNKNDSTQTPLNMAPGRTDSRVEGALSGARIYILVHGWTRLEVLRTLAYIRVSRTLLFIFAPSALPSFHIPLPLRALLALSQLPIRQPHLALSPTPTLTPLLTPGPWRHYRQRSLGAICNPCPSSHTERYKGGAEPHISRRAPRPAK